jgi:hypothetical protein
MAISMIVVVAILLIGSAGMFALGFFVGRRSRADQRGFDVVAVHDESNQH